MDDYVDIARQGYYQISDTDIVYLVRRNKHDSSRFKLVKTTFDSSLTTQTYPTDAATFWNFENIKVFGFAMRIYPNMDSIIGQDQITRSIYYYTVDHSTYTVSNK
jgi:hypothetical protein